MGSKERKVVDANTVGIKCVRAVSLRLVIVFRLAFLFCMNNNICVFLKSTGNLLLIAMHSNVTFCLSQGSPIRHGKTDFATQEEYIVTG